jgi:hypothetical protein
MFPGEVLPRRVIYLWGPVRRLSSPMDYGHVNEGMGRPWFER